MNQYLTKLTSNNTHKLITYIIAGVWLANGLFCKVLNLVPRHEQIVARILGDEYARPLTLLIGLSEIVMAIWIVMKFKSKWNATLQVIIIIAMNVIEFINAPDLLLWGRVNIVFSVIFSSLIYYNEFVLDSKSNVQV